MATAVARVCSFAWELTHATSVAKNGRRKEEKKKAEVEISSSKRIMTSTNLAPPPQLL